MAYASKLSTITAPPAAVLEPLTAVLALPLPTRLPPPPPTPRRTAPAAVLEPLTAVLMPPAGYPNRESFAAGSLGDRTQ